MTRVQFRDDGISSMVSNDLNKAKSYLESAEYYTNYNIPSDFRYRDYLSKLRNVIKEYEKKLEKIRNQVPKTDEDLLKVFKRINKIVNMETLDRIPEKERLIK